MAELPNRIRELRKARGWSLQKLGDEAGCSLQWVGDIERGTSELTVAWMRRFAKALGVQPADLLLPQDNSDSLSDEERDLIYRLRTAAPDEREKFNAIAEVVVPFRPQPQERKTA